MKRLLLMGILLTPFGLVAETKPNTQFENYNLFGAELTSGTMDGVYAAGRSDNTTALAIHLSYRPLANQLLLISDYSARFYHPQDQTVEQYRLRVGAGYFWPLRENLHLLTHIKVGGLRISGNQVTNNLTREIYSADLGLRYAIDEHWLISLLAEANFNHWQDEYVYTLKADYQLNRRLALGAMMTFRDGEYQDINEFGMTLRIHY